MGTKRFGLCLLTPDGLSMYGTVLEILHHKVFPDARLLTVSKGRERFRLVKILQERPVLVCDVEYLEDEADEEALTPSADELKSLFRDVLKLNARYKNMPVDEEFLVCSPALLLCISFIASISFHQQGPRERDWKLYINLLCRLLLN